MNSEFLAKVLYGKQVEKKKSLGYHNPGDCENAFGCGRCSHRLAPWEDLSEGERAVFLEWGESIVSLLGEVGHTNIYCTARWGGPCTCTT